MRGEVFSHAGIHCRIAGLPRGQSIDIAVVHAEGSCDEYGIVDLKVSRTFSARLSYAMWQDIFAALLDLACYHEKSFELF